MQQWSGRSPHSMHHPKVGNRQCFQLLTALFLLYVFDIGSLLMGSVMAVAGQQAAAWVPRPRQQLARHRLQPCHQRGLVRTTTPSGILPCSSCVSALQCPFCNLTPSCLKHFGQC